MTSMYERVTCRSSPNVGEHNESQKDLDRVHVHYLAQGYGDRGDEEDGGNIVLKEEGLGVSKRVKLGQLQQK